MTVDAWLPIETAPSGRRILVWLDEGGGHRIGTVYNAGVDNNVDMPCYIEGLGSSPFYPKKWQLLPDDPAPDRIMEIIACPTMRLRRHGTEWRLVNGDTAKSFKEWQKLAFCINGYTAEGLM